MDPEVDKFLKTAKTWQAEMIMLREIVLECGLKEEYKWRLPCYTLDDKNIVIIQPFRDYFALMFFKGALLKDSRNVLVSPGNSQAARQVRMTNAKDIVKFKSTLKSYIKEAVKIEKEGLKVKLKETKDYKIPEEFQRRMNKMPKLKAAFEALTPGRQRGYLHYFSHAKLSKTREERVAKCEPLILKGKGLKD